MAWSDAARAAALEARRRNKKTFHGLDKKTARKIKSEVAKSVASYNKANKDRKPRSYWVAHAKKYFGYKGK